MQPNQHSDDEQYKQATKSVVDDAMRTDILGPNLQRVLKDHKPVHDQVTALLADAIENSSKVQKSLKGFIDDYGTRRKGVWLDRIISGTVGAGVIAIVEFARQLLRHGK